MTECARRVARGGWAEDAALNRCTWPIGPRNTWSNVSYPLAGLALWLDAPSATRAAFAVSLLGLGVGSGLYHGLKTRWANQLDWAGMYLVFAALTLHGIVPDVPWLAWVGVPLAAAVAWFGAYRLNGIGVNGHMGLFLGLSMLPPLVRGDWRLAGVAFGLFLLAYACWQLDRRRLWTGLWGHALWHVLTAAALALMFLAQESSRRP